MRDVAADGRSNNVRSNAMVKMQAAVVREFGGPEVLNIEEVPIPECNPGEVLVQVRAAGVGPWDAWVRGGQSAVSQPLPLVPGSDVSGIVAAVGPGVSNLAVGDTVYGATNARFTNGYAEFAPCTATMLARKPARLSDVEAASAPVIAVTAWQMLFDHAALTHGQRVLIHGAGGNVGRYAIQLAQHAHLEVLATASPRDEGWISDLGVRVIDVTEPDVQASAVIDLVGGETQPLLFDWLVPGGALISAVSQPHAELAAKRDIRASFILVEVRSDILDRLGELFEAAVIKPWVGEVLPLSQARATHEMLAGTRDHLPGKIVLRP